MPTELTYDTLPLDSRLQRVVNDDGSITISSPVGEKSERARDRALRGSAIVGAVGAAIVGALAHFIVKINLSTRWPNVWWITPLLWTALFGFVAGTFLFIWRIGYAKRLAALERAWEQTTVLNFSPTRVLAETAGPFGTHSIAIDESADWGFSVSRAPASAIDCLLIEFQQKQVVLFPGFSLEELDWIFGELRRVVIPRQQR